MLYTLYSAIIPSLLAPLAFSSSFYDNPEQDPLPSHGQDAAEELHQKWDFEVVFSTLALPSSACAFTLNFQLLSC